MENPLAANFEQGEVAVLTRFDDVASGLFVQIRNVYSERFPQVMVEFTVEDRMRRPILGLDTNNFLLTEGGNVASDQVFLLPGHRHPGSDISILVERSDRTARLSDDLGAAARDIVRVLQEMNGSKIVSVVSAGSLPRREQQGLPLENSVRGTADLFRADWRFDLGLRESATNLLTASAKRSVVFIGSGNIGDKAFETYSLSELANYLANNNIVFNAIIIGGGQVSSAINYLCAETGGRAMPLYRPRGIGELIRSTAEIPSPLYSFTFNSRIPTDFGRALLPLEIEVYLIERSGRDNTGYFPPIE
jgi:DNA-binding beta-propeller fold protein YncE